MHKLERGKGSLLPGRMSIVLLVMQEHDLHDLQASPALISSYMATSQTFASVTMLVEQDIQERLHMLFCSSNLRGQNGRKKWRSHHKGIDQLLGGGHLEIPGR